MKQLTVRIVGPKRSGKTVLAETIYAALKKHKLYNTACIDLIDHVGNYTDEIDPDITIITEEGDPFDLD